MIVGCTVNGEQTMIRDQAEWQTLRHCLDIDHPLHSSDMADGPVEVVDDAKSNRFCSHCSDCRLAVAMHYRLD